MNMFTTPNQDGYSFNTRTIAIPFKYFMLVAYLYMVVPITIFFLGWLKLYLGVSAAIVLLGGLFYLIKNTDSNIYLILPIRDVIISGVIITIWLWSSSYFFYQTWDYLGRNAVLRDLIDFDWPVIYSQTNYALVYYFTHWMLPALVGKLFGFTVANAALVLWNAFGVFIAFIGLCFCTLPKRRSHLWIILSLLILWNGLTEVGWAWMDVLGTSGLSLSSGFGWPDAYDGYGYQYTPNDALLAWVFNQTIVPWIAVTLFIKDHRVCNYAFLGLCVVPFGPLPFLGLVFFMMVDYVCVIRQKGISSALKETASIQNCCAAVSVFPVFYLFFKCNVSANHIGIYPVNGMFQIRHIVFLLVFYMLQFGIYCLLIRSDYSHSLLFATIVVSLVVIPHIQLGYERDFCMRASIPALFILMYMVIQFLLSHIDDLQLRREYVLLIICLSVSGWGIIKDGANRVKVVRANDWHPYIQDEWGTISDKRIGETGTAGLIENYVDPDWIHDTFFEYLADVELNQ